MVGTETKVLGPRAERWPPCAVLQGAATCTPGLVKRLRSHACLHVACPQHVPQVLPLGRWGRVVNRAGVNEDHEVTGCSGWSACPHFYWLNISLCPSFPS